MFWINIIKSCDRILFSKICYNVMLYDIIVLISKDELAKHDRNVLNEKGFSHVWNNQGVANDFFNLYFYFFYKIYMYKVGNLG